MLLIIVRFVVWGLLVQNKGEPLLPEIINNTKLNLNTMKTN